MTKKRVLILINNYPTLSQTYKENEIKHLYQDYEVKIGSLSPSEAHYKIHFPFVQINSQDELVNLIREFKPEVIHGHYAFTAHILHFAAVTAACKFTIRMHSWDVLQYTAEQIKKFVPFLNSEHCAGILTFPYTIPYLISLGVNPDKLKEDWPVIDYDRFYDTTPNGKDIINVGACIPKKNMEFFIDIAKHIPQRNFFFYPIGYNRELLVAYNGTQGNPVKIMETVEPFEMPAIYKNCEWLLYSANLKMPTVGWPMAIAEAQAAGVGVLMQNIRPDLKTYIGDAGYLFNTMDEAIEILSQPYPESMRQKGFEQAKKSDIKVNIKKLTSLW